MIKIELNEMKFRNGETRVAGTVEAKGDTEILTHEIYAIMKEFEENATEAFINALDLVMDEFVDKMKGEDD